MTIPPFWKQKTKDLACNACGSKDISDYGFCLTCGLPIVVRRVISQPALRASFHKTLKRQTAVSNRILCYHCGHRGRTVFEVLSKMSISDYQVMAMRSSSVVSLELLQFLSYKNPTSLDLKIAACWAELEKATLLFKKQDAPIFSSLISTDEATICLQCIKKYLTSQQSAEQKKNISLSATKKEITKLQVSEKTDKPNEFTEIW